MDVGAQGLALVVLMVVLGNCLVVPDSSYHWRFALSEVVPEKSMSL